MPNESGLKEWLGKDVGWVVVGSDARHAHYLVGFKLSDFEVAARDLARARARLELARELLSPGVVDVEGRGDALVHPEVAKDALEVDDLGRCLRGGHDSASVELRAMQCCLWLEYPTGAPAKMMQKPVVEWRTAKSESE